MIGFGLRQSKFAENVADMLFDRPFADHKLLANRLIGAALGHESKHLSFAGRQ